MRGRQWFQRFRPLLRIAVLFMQIFPASLVNLLLVLLRHLPTKVGVGLRYILLARLATACGDNVAIYEGVYLYQMSRAVFGSHVSIHPLCYIDATGGLSIGSNVSIAHAVTIMTTEHDYARSNLYTRDAPTLAAAVCIEDGVWIGAGARILAGVTLGRHAVVGAGAVVTRDVAPYTVVAGVPARLIQVFEKELR